MDTLRRRGLLLGGAAAALAACGPTGPTDRGGASSGGSGAVTAPGQSTQSGQLAQGAQQGAPLAERQILRLNAGSEPDTIDPQKASFVGEIAVIMRVFSNLLTYNDKGELVPEMAEKMPAVSGDGRTMTFTLKPGLKYSDGRALTAKDFEYAWKRHLDPRTKAQYAFTGYVIEGAEEFNTASATDAASLDALRAKVGVTATDERTLQFKLRAPAPWFMSVLATWCGVPTRQDLVEKAGEKWTEPATYVGNGPYKLLQWEHQDRMLFEANASYHKGAAALKHVELAMINEPAVAFAAYRNGELDVVGVQAEDVPAVNNDAQLKQHYQRYPGSCSYYVGMNTKSAPFDKVAVRRAVAASFNRQSFVENVMGGIGLPAEQFLPPKFPGHFEDLKAQKFDAAGAKRLLAEGGFPDAKGFPQVKFTYSANARSKVRVEALANQLQQAMGITVLADPVESRAFTAMMKDQATTPPMFLLGWCQDYPDPQNWYSTVFHSRASVSHTGWKNAEFDRLVEQGDVEQDKNRRNEAYKKAAQILMDDAPAAFLYHGVVSRLVKPHVVGLPQNPLDYFEGQSNLFNVKITKH